MDKATIDPEALDEVLEASALLHDPPEGMLAALSWEEDDGPVTMVSLWESPGARGQAAMERMMPLFETGLLGERHHDPDPIRQVHIYVRGRQTPAP